jgi:hypothetical protein
MFDVSRDALGPIGLGGFAFVLGLTAFGLGHTEFGRLWPYPRMSWGILGAGLVLVGMGFFLMGVGTGASLPPEADMPAALVRPLGFYVLLGGLLIAGLWGPWVYLQQRLYATKGAVVGGKLEIAHERTHRLRQRDLAAVAAGVGALVGFVAFGIANTLVSFSQGDLAPIAATVGAGCVIGGVAFGVVFLVLLLGFRHDLIAD